MDKNVLATARVFGTFGLDGAVKIESLSGEYDHLCTVHEIWLASPQKKEDLVPYTVRAIELRHSDALLWVEGVVSMEAAKRLVGSLVYVRREEACPLQEGEFYIDDLCLCNVYYQADMVGKIANVVEGGGGYLLEILEAATGSYKYVPFNHMFIGQVSLKDKTVELMHRWILE